MYKSQSYVAESLEVIFRNYMQGGHPADADKFVVLLPCPANLPVAVGV